MLDTLYIATSGMMAHAKGLRTVGNNLANVNTPGFKAAQEQFGALFEQGTGQLPLDGRGVETSGTQIMFKAGTEQSTGNPLDLSINGSGMFVVKRDDKLLYTRDGRFHFNDQDILVNNAGDQVQALDKDGKLTDVHLDTLFRNEPKVTSSVKFSGNLTSTVATPAVDATVNGVTIIDPQGIAHTVNLTFKNAGGGKYTVDIKDGIVGGTSLGSGTLEFNGGFPIAGKDKISFNYSSTGVTAFKVELDFSGKVVSQATDTTLGVASQDGHVPGMLSDQSIDADGFLNVVYSNTQKAKGARLALANFTESRDLNQLGGGMFELTGGGPVHYGYANTESFGQLAAGRREGSNVDLAEEFGNLILMQRGYQASSHVISTANDMIQQLFDMKGNR